MTEESPFVGLLIDETVNVTVHKKLIVFLRILVDGKPKTIFVGNFTVTAGDAETLFRKLTEIFEENRIDTSKMIGFGSDGAAVMMGKHSGVGVRMKQDISPHMVHVHCVVHQVALASSHDAKAMEKNH